MKVGIHPLRRRRTTKRSGQKLHQCSLHTGTRSPVATLAFLMSVRATRRTTHRPSRTCTSESVRRKLSGQLIGG